MKITFNPDHYVIDDLHVPKLHEHLYCIFDLEGTGILPDRESVTQFGAMEYKRGEVGHSTFSTLSRASKPIPDAVAELTGISNADMKTAPAFVEAYHSFSTFIGERLLVSHAGYEYDLPILKRHCEQFGVKMFSNKVLDTKAMFTYIHPEVCEVISTDYLIRHYNIDTEGIRRHDALADCDVIARILDHLLQEYEERGLDHFTADPTRSIRRFEIPEMYSSITEDGGST
ncbi:PolC-type DNA polymerase III [Paenibacillus xylanilyticus]|uniref:3'-5' exonuclease n=1 Tax=Paenibacillus xylanilyticus TaxID=248903 RepID=UPI00129D42A2|nr:3'-5' exonuclease [Paenibacillus xylanilyticus]